MYIFFLFISIKKKSLYKIRRTYAIFFIYPCFKHFNINNTTIPLFEDEKEEDVKYDRKIQFGGGGDGMDGDKSGDVRQAQRKWYGCETIKGRIQGGEDSESCALLKEKKNFFLISAEQNVFRTYNSEVVNNTIKITMTRIVYTPLNNNIL